MAWQGAGAGGGGGGGMPGGETSGVQAYTLQGRIGDLIMGIRADLVTKV